MSGSITNRPKFWKVELLVFVSIVALIFSTTFFSVKKLEQNRRHEMGTALKTVLEMSCKAFDIWVNKERARFQDLLNSENILLYSQQLLDLPADKTSLLNSPIQNEIREYCRPFFYNRNVEGIFIISHENVNLASMRNANVGDTNLISKHAPHLLQKAFNGNIVLIPPIRSDVPIGAKNPFSSNYYSPSMFLAGPVKNEEGNIIAVFSIRLDPYEVLSNVTTVGRIGETGETYAFNVKGQLISHSRFSDDLLKFGFIKNKNEELLKLVIKDPRINLTESPSISINQDSLMYTHMASQALQGYSGLKVDGYRDYRGVRVLGAWKWFKEYEIGFATEINETEALKSFKQSYKLILLVSLFVVFIFALLYVILLRNRISAVKAVEKKSKALEKQLLEVQAAKQAIEAGERMFGKLVENMNEGLLVIDINGKVQYANKAIANMLETSKNDIVGKETSTFLSISMQDSLLSEIDKGNVSTFESSIIKKDGTKLHIIVSPQTLKGLDGSYNGSFAIITNITEQKKVLEEVETYRNHLEEVVTERTADLKTVNQKLSDEVKVRKEMEQALIEEHEVLQNILKTVDVIIVSLNINGNVETINKKGTELLGYETDQLYGNNWYHCGIFNEEDANKCEVLFKEMVANKNEASMRFEAVIITKHQRERLVAWNNRLLFNSAGEPVGLISAGEDITTQKRVLKELQRSEEKYRNLVDNAISGVFQVNFQGEFLYVNPELPKIFDYPSQNDMMKVNIVRLIPKKQLKKCLSLINQHKKLSDYELEIETPAGNKKHLILSALKRNKLITGMVIDNTKRKQAEEARRLSEEHYKSLLESMTDTVYVLNKNWEYTILNEQAIKTMALPREEIIGETPFKLIPDFEGTEFYRVMKNVMDNQVADEVTVKYDWLDGASWFYLRVFPMPNKGILCISSDVSSVKQNELDLIESKERLQLTLDASHIGLWLWDITNNVLTWDNRMSEIFDLPLSMVQNYENFTGCVHNEDVERVNAEVNASIKNKTDFDTDYRVVWKNGSIRTVLAQGKVSYNEEGEAEKMHGVCIDITERKIAEKALRDSEEKFKRIFSTIQDAYILMNMNGKIISINPATETILEYKESDLINKYMVDFLLPRKEDLNTLQLILQEEGSLSNYQMELLTKSNENIIADCNIHYVYDESKSPVAIEATFRDSTERIWIEEALKSSLNLNKMMGNYSVSEILEFGLEEAVRLTRSNIGFFHFVNEDLGTISLQIWSKGTMKHCDVPEKEEHYSVEKAGIWADAIRYRRPIIHNNYVKAANKKGLPEGHYPLIREVVVPVFEQDQIVAVVGVGNKVKEYNQFDLNQLLLVAENIWSIVRRKRAEENLKEAKESAEMANRSKSVFLANMSHEIRTPMNAVIGFAEILHEQIQEPIQRNYLDSIKASGKTLLQLINDILDLSKIEAGKLEIQMEPVNIRSVLNEIEHIFILKASQKNLTFTVECDENISDNYLLDELRMRQILLNLVGNAIKFTEKGEVKIVVSIEQNDPPGDSVNIKIQVIDTGIGIPKEAHKSIFESFSQQDDQDVRKYGGTGLGLAICQKLVVLMGGNITVDSEPGKGSTFTVLLGNTPITEEKIISELDYDYSAINFESSTILLVDDIESNRSLVKGYLQNTPLKIIDAENGRQAVTLAEKHVPDLIFMDIRMPVMDGVEATEIIRSNTKFNNTAIVCLTASLSIKESTTKRYKEIFNGFLKKPVSKVELFEEMKKHLTFKSEANKKIEVENTDKSEGITDLKELVDKINKVLIPQWNRVKDAFDMDEFANFNRTVKTIAEKYNSNRLLQFNEEFSAQIESFDVEMIEIMINSFPGIVEKYQNMLKD